MVKTHKDRNYKLNQTKWVGDQRSVTRLISLTLRHRMHIDVRVSAMWAVRHWQRAGETFPMSRTGSGGNVLCWLGHRRARRGPCLPRWECCCAARVCVDLEKRSRWQEVEATVDAASRDAELHWESFVDQDPTPDISPQSQKIEGRHSSWALSAKIWIPEDLGASLFSTTLRSTLCYRRAWWLPNSSEVNLWRKRKLIKFQ